MTQKNKILRLLIGTSLGALAGYLYYSNVGCMSGSCWITSSPWISTLYGSLLGYLFIDGLSSFLSPQKK